MTLKDWRSRLDKRKRIKRRRENLRPITRIYIAQKTERGRKVHMAIVGGGETFCGLLESRRRFTIAESPSNVTCARCIRVQNEIIQMVIDSRKQREMKSAGHA